MIDAKRAARAAMSYFQEMGAETGHPPVNVSLEEVERSKDGRSWLITLGYYEDSASAVFSALSKRYKVFQVDAASGEVLSMKIRPVG